MSESKETTRAIGQRLVSLSNDGKDDVALAELYSDQIVSVESADGGIPARLEGLEAVKGKHDWWNNTVEVHSASAEGPYIGFADDQFAVRFTIDATIEGQRSTMEEIGLYTVAGGKIVEDRYLELG